MQGSMKKVDRDGDLSPTTAGGGDSEDIESYLSVVWHDRVEEQYENEVADLAQLLENEIQSLQNGQPYNHNQQTATPPPTPGVQLRIPSPPSGIPPTLPIASLRAKEVSSTAPSSYDLESSLISCPSSDTPPSPLLALCMDQSGNHLVQKLLESPKSRLEAYEQILKGHCVELAYNTYGCRVLQKALDCLPVEIRIDICHRELSPHIATLMQDQNGNHVIQKCVDRLPPDTCHPIIKACLKDPLKTSLHAYGCRVMQRILEHCKHNRWTHMLLDKLLGVLPALLKDQFGNYVVQHILKYGRYCDVKCIVDIVVCNLLSYSCHKFSSNVAERCLERYIPVELKVAVVSAAFDTVGCTRPPILSMIRDPYANYVVQKILSSELIDLDNPQRRDVLNKLEKHLPALRKFTYGRHIVEGIEKLKRRAEASHQ